MALTKVTGHVVKTDTNVHTHNINSSGIVTAIGLDVSGNISVGGTLTYQDVTSVDSVGIITAQSGIEVGGQGTNKSILFHEANNSPSNGDSAGEIKWASRVDKTVTAQIKAAAFNNNNGTDGVLTFWTANDTASGDSANHLKETFRIDQLGRTLIGNQRTVSDLGYYDDLTINNSNAASGASGSAGITLVAGDSAWCGLNFGRSGDMDEGHIRYDNTNNAMVFGTGDGGEKLRITSSGVLKLTGQSTSFETAGLTHHTNNNLYIRGGTTGAILQNVNGQEAWIVQNNYLSASTSDVERLRINNSGHIGIKTTSVYNGALLSIGVGQGANIPSGEHIKIAPSANTITFLDSANNTSDTGNIQFWNTVYNNCAAKVEFYHPAANLGGIKFHTKPASGSNPVEALRIDHEGIIWVNHSNPLSSSLMILDKDGSGEAALRFYNAGSNKAQIALDSSEELTFDVNGAERLRITSSGQFHMGGGNSWTYASQKFVVVEPSNALGMILQGNHADEGVNLTLQNIVNANNAYSSLSFADDGGQIFGIVRGKVNDKNANTGELQFWTSGSQKLTIDKDGDVGIGEASPGSNNEKLTVREDIAAASGKAIISIFNLHQGTAGQGNASTGALEFTFKNHNASHNWWGGRIGCFNTDNYNQYTYLRFDTASQGNASGKMWLTHNGKLGIGTDNPSQTLTIFGASSSGLRISKSGVLAYDHTFDGSTYEIKNNNGNAGIPIVFGTKTSGGESLRITAAGKVSISSDGTADGLLTIKGDSDATTTPSIRLLDGSDSREVSISNQSGDFIASVHGTDNAAHGHIKLFEGGQIDLNNGGASGSNVNRLRIFTDGQLQVSAPNSNSHFSVGNSSGTMVVLDTTEPSAVGVGGRIVFGSKYYNASNTMAGAFIGQYKVAAPSNGTDEYRHALNFGTRNENDGLVERMRITHKGQISIDSRSNAGTVFGNARLSILPESRTSAFSASDGDTWHDVVLHQGGSATNNAVGLAFQLKNDGSYHKNAGTGIAAVKNGTNSDYGADLVFITRPQSAVAEERLRIDSNGDLRVAASTDLSSPNTGYKRIIIGNNLIFNAGSSAGGYTGFQNNAYVNSSGNWVRVNNDHASSIGMDDGNIYFRNTGAGTGNISWNMPLQIASDGQATFDKGAPGSSNQVIARFQAESSRRLDIVWHDSGSLMGFDTPSSHAYIFKIGGSEKLLIKSTGYAQFAGASDVRLTLGSQGTAGSNTANWVRGQAADLMYNAASGSHIWEIGGNEKVRIKSDGDVIIQNHLAVDKTAVETLTGNGVNAKLQVNSGSNDYDGIMIGGGYNRSTITTGGNYDLVYTSNAYPANATSKGHRWLCGSSGGGGPNERMQLHQDGVLKVYQGVDDQSNGGASFYTPQNTGYIGTRWTEQGAAFVFYMGEMASGSNSNATNNYVNLYASHHWGDYPRIIIWAHERYYRTSFTTWTFGCFGGSSPSHSLTQTESWGSTNGSHGTDNAGSISVNHAGQVATYSSSAVHKYELTMNNTGNYGYTRWYIGILRCSRGLYTSSTSSSDVDTSCSSGGCVHLKTMGTTQMRNITYLS